jgi:hypothetical protein
MLGNETRLGPVVAAGPEVHGVGGCREESEDPVSVKRHDAAVEADMDLDSSAGAGGRPATRQLQDPAAQVDRAVPDHLAAVLEGEHAVEVEIGRQRPPAGPGSAAGTAKRSLKRRR